MEARRNLSSLDKRWAAADLCGLLIGAGTRLVLSNTGTNPILQDLSRFHVASLLIHYAFNPLAYTAVVTLFVFQIVRLNFAGFWSVFFSFMVGGMLATILLAL